MTITVSPRDQAAARLYCFPHAGASASVYRHWTPLAPPDLVIRPLDPPGRGRRAKETACRTFAALVQAQAETVVRDLDEHPDTTWLVLGHSFGSMVAAATATAVSARTGRPPALVVVSAGLPPAHHVPRDEAADLDDDDLLSRIMALGGTAPELMDGGAMSRLLVRLFREDYAIRGEFHRQQDLLVDAPLLVVSAEDDRETSAARMAGWSAHTRGGSTHLSIEGGHFAAVDDPTPLLQHVSDHLTQRVG